MPSLFDFLGSINNKKVYYKSDEELKGYSIWMVNRFLMSEPLYAPVIAELNSSYILTDRMHYDFLFHALPKTNKFMKYGMKSEKKEEVILNVMQYFNVDLRRAKTYMALISEEELESILDFYGKRGLATKGKSKKK